MSRIVRGPLGPPVYRRGPQPDATTGRMRRAADAIVATTRQAMHGPMPVRLG